ncbi:UNVERIFIED_CONTAM: hypothetical protein GTU68_031473 [Idotea baltica]|nr:hypothetical protein [Idotea baltica]
MGLIYVNPEGPNGNPDPIASARDIRETFARMAMNDEETVALIAGGHTFGKCHGAAPDTHLGAEPEAGSTEEQGLGWKNSFNSGKGVDTITSGLEGAWTKEPAKWDNNFFENLFEYDWELVKGSGGASQWTPKDESAKGTVPDAHDPSKSHAPIMLTTDLALKEDPEYAKISKRFYENPDQFAEAFAQAWFKLTHRDMGPASRYLGDSAPKEPLLWQDPIPEVTHELVDDSDISKLKIKLLDCGLSISQLVTTAWASASSFRNTDKRGGANGARICLAPQRDWEVNQPQELEKAIKALAGVMERVSMADLIVLGGSAAVEEAAKKAGHSVKSDFKPGRGDTTQELTDIESVAMLEPAADAFRNYVAKTHASSSEQLLVERACLLSLSAPEMSVLLAGMRVLNTNAGSSELGVLSKQKESLTNDFFVNLLDMNTVWNKSSKCEHFYEGKDRSTGEVKWSATAVDLVFGSNSQLRAIAEVYASEDAQQKFVQDFVAVWDKVMNLDRFDLA